MILQRRKDAFHLESAAFVVHMNAKTVEDSRQEFHPVIASRVFLSPQQVGFWLAPFSQVKPAPQTRGCPSD
jgi:hypothetical protein